MGHRAAQRELDHFVREGDGAATMSETRSGPDLLNELAHEFAQRFRKGERLSLTEYTDRYPELAAQIRDLFPALMMIEQFGSVERPPTDTQPRTATSDGTVPKQLGEYRILREVARGGMGIVYEAVQESLGRHVALKVLPFQSLSDATYRERFRREAQAAAKLHHTNIVPVFGVGEHEGVHYFAMQLIQGQPLNSVLHELKRRRRSGVPRAGEPAETPSPVPEEWHRQELTVTLAGNLVTGRFSAREREPGDSERGEKVHRVRSVDGSSSGLSASHTVVSGDDSELGEQSEANYFRSVARVGVQVAEALAYAHEQGIVHRDIKPSNLLLDTHGTVWVTDFGLAKAEGTGELTSPGDLLGTMRYMAPERFQGQADPRSDVFSLGLTLYEMVTLRPAFAAAERAPLIEKMLHSEPPRPRQLDGRIPRDLETIILKAISKEPARRYQTAADLAADLQLFLADRPIRARRTTAVERFGRWCHRNPWLAGANIAAAVLTTTLAIGATLAAWTFRDQRDQIGRHVGRLQEAERKGQERLLDSLMAQASARRQSRRVGQRFEGLEALGQAAAIARGLGLPAEQFDLLRDEAIACMALPDMKPTGRAIQHPPDGVAVAFDSLMTRYALRFRDGTILVRSVADDEEVARFSAQGDREIDVFGFSPDGRYLATIHMPSRALTVWDIDRRAVAVNEPGPISGGGAEFSPDSRRIAVGRQDGGLLVYDLATGTPCRRWPGLSLWGPVFSADGTQIAIYEHVDKNYAIRIVHAESGRLVRSFALPLLPFAKLAWSSDGATLATPCDDRKIYLWDVATGTRRATLEGSNAEGLHAAFHPTGTLLVSNGWEGRFRLWDAVLGRSLLSVTGGGPTWFSKDGRIVVVTGPQIAPYQVDPALEYRTLSHASSQSMKYRSAAIRRDGRVMAVATSRGLVLWDLTHGAELRFLPLGKVWGVIFEESGDLLTSGSIGVRRWPVRLDLARAEFRIGPPRQLPLPGTGGVIASDRRGQFMALPDHEIALVVTPERIFHVGPLDDCRYVGVSPDGEWLATGSHVATKGAQVWHIRDATKVADLPVDYGTGVVFSPDGKWLMTTTEPCRLWTVGTWHEARQLGGVGCCFSPDGRLVAVVDPTRIIRLVETETGHTVARLESPDLCEVYAACFSPVGSRLVVSTNDGPGVHVWDLRAIRRKLAEMGLDWHAPAYSDDDPANSSTPALPPLHVDLGPLPLAATADPRAYEPVINDLEAALASKPDQTSIRGRLAERCNDYAWNLANATGSSRNPERALTLARRAVELAPNWADYLNTLGVAQYRAGRFAEAIATLDRSLAAGQGQSDGYDLLFQAMAQWQLGHRPEAQACFRKAAEWMEKHQQGDEELIPFRAEAAAMLGVKEKKD
jgi:serine/threonine protein kinase/WD40 repeat protein